MLSFILLLALSTPTPAEGKKLTTSIYEQEAEEPKTESFSAKVRVVRDISDEIEVFFEGDAAKGAYTLPRSLKNYGAYLKALEKSRTPKGPAVSIIADENKQIKSVEINKPKGFQPPADPNQKWDFGKIPD